MSKSGSTDSSIVSHIRVPKKNHDAMLQICKEAYEMFKQHGILYTSFYPEVNIPGTDNNTSPTCSSTFLYTKLGVIEGGQFTSTAA